MAPRLNPNGSRARRRLAPLGFPFLLGVVSLVGACTAEIAGGAGGPNGNLPGSPGAVDGSGPGDGTGPGEVGPTTQAHPVPKLLRLSNEEYLNIISDVLGTPVDKALFAGWTPIAQVYGFDTMSESRIDSQGLDEQLKTAASIATLALQSPALTSLCPASVTPALPTEATALTWDNCGKPLVTRLASRAFRRPARAEEIADYQLLFDSSRQEAVTAAMPHPFYEGLSTVIQAVVLSPNFMFKPELVPGGLDATERSHGVASRLSLFFRSSIADDELLSLAEAGQLNDLQLVEQQAKRLLDTYQDRFSRNFGGQWLDFREPLKEADALMASMQNEVRDVFQQVLSGDLEASRLMAPGFTLVDQPLAVHYGLAFDASGSAVQQIPSDNRGGLLSHGFFLTRTATGSEFRRPIHRGLWAMTRLLCRTLPRLEPATLEEISESFANIDRTLPLSEQMATHRASSPRCLSCHGEIDPIGLALEKYDAKGFWRETYLDGSPIVSDLELYGVKVGDPMKLASAIEGSEEYRTCVASKVLTYALNRGPLTEEASVSAGLATLADGSQPSFKAMIVGAFMKSLKLTEVAP